MNAVGHKELERILKAFANKRRLAIVQLVQKRKEISVGNVAREIHVSIKATSRHLALLSGAGVLDKEQRGLQMFYRLAPDMPDLARKILPFL
jgi:DNA-binding transcriptional ArsR family regulator